MASEERPASEGSLTATKGLASDPITKGLPSPTKTDTDPSWDITVLINSFSLS